jgi:hypothetical protein
MICEVALAVSLINAPAMAVPTVTAALDIVTEATGVTFSYADFSYNSDLIIQFYTDNEVTDIQYQAGGSQGEFTKGQRSLIHIWTSTFNANGQWGWQYGNSLGPLLLHEIGHTFGLPHYEPHTLLTFRRSIMSPQLKSYGPTTYTKTDRQMLSTTCERISL